MAVHMHNSYYLVRKTTCLPIDAKGSLTLTPKNLGHKKRPQIKDHKK